VPVPGPLVTERLVLEVPAKTNSGPIPSDSRPDGTGKIAFTSTGRRHDGVVIFSVTFDPVPLMVTLRSSTLLS